MKTELLIIVVCVGITIISIGVVLWPEYGMVCNNAVTEHLKKYSNLFDENTTRQTYVIVEIGYPFGIHGGNIQECIDYVLEQRELVQNKN